MMAPGARASRLKKMVERVCIGTWMHVWRSKDAAGATCLYTADDYQPRHLLVMQIGFLSARNFRSDLNNMWRALLRYTHYSRR